MARGKSVVKWAGGVFGAVSLAAATTIWFLGPTWGVFLAGQPVFLIPPSPQRYAKAVFDIAEKQGLYAGSEEFAAARSYAEDAIRDAEDIESTYPHLREVVRAAGGKHSNFIEPRDAQRMDQLPREMPSVDIDAGVVTVTLPGTGSGEHVQEYADTAAFGLVEHLNAGACGVVVDLRGNTGGDMGPMVAGISPLLPDGEVLWFVTPTHSTPVTVSGNGVEGGGTSVTTAAQGKFDVPVAVLVDARTISSGEATMLTFRGLGNSRSFGQPTAGYATANITFSMPDGARVMLTTAHERARSAEEFGDDPIIPDVVTEDAEAAARTWVTEQGCL